MVVMNLGVRVLLNQSRYLSSINSCQITQGELIAEKLSILRWLNQSVPQIPAKIVSILNFTTKVDQWIYFMGEQDFENYLNFSNAEATFI